MSWEKVKIGDILTRRRDTIKVVPQKDYKLVTIKLYHKGVVLRSVEKGENIKSSMSLVKGGDFILSGIDARNGAFGIVPDDLDGAIVTNDFWCLDPDKRFIDKDFLLFLTTTEFFDYICKQSSDGVTQRIRLQREKFFNYEITLPPISDQKLLVSKLKELEFQSQKLSSELNYQSLLVKKLRQQLLQDAVQGKLVEQDPNDEPTSELLKRIKADKEQLIKEKKLKKEKELPPIKADELPYDIPGNWTWCRLGEICNYGSSPKAEPKFLTKDTWVLDLEDIEKESSRLLCKIRFVERNSLSTKSVFQKGQVLYSKLRPYLDKVIVSDEDGVCTTEILPLKFYGEINPFFMRYSLKRNDFLNYVNSVTKGMKMPRLGTVDGQMALIPLPPLLEQLRIIQNLDDLMKICNMLEECIKKSISQNDKLVQQVLSESLQ